MKQDLRRPAILFFVAMFSLFAGCSRKAAELAGVEGIVRINGQPAPHVAVKFMPDLGKGNQGQFSEATTDEEGRYRLVCYKQGPGAAVGWHKVLLSDVDALNQRLPGDKHRIAVKYSQLDRTPLEFEVKPGKQTINLDATPPGP
jgi:hypothetical protein